MNNSRTFDYIICGQGIAGTLLAFNLIESGKKVLVVDDYNVHSSSNVAAGIVVPVTGRRIVKTWMADVLLPHAFDSFKKLEELTAAQFYFNNPVLELLNSSKQKNDWQQRLADNNIAGYVEGFIPKEEIPIGIEATHGAVKLRQCHWLNTKIFLQSMKLQFEKYGVFEKDKIAWDELEINSSSIKWKNVIANKIIFCSGSNNIPLFDSVPFQFSKGEILTIHCNDLAEDYIINHGIFILPLGNNQFKVGSTYSWTDLSHDPTAEGRGKIETELKSILKLPYTVINHEAGIRPTIKERRPVIGFHPIYKNVGIMNGLGTKGVLIAPWLAKHFCSHITNNSAIDPEVDVKRFLLPG